VGPGDKDEVRDEKLLWASWQTIDLEKEPQYQTVYCCTVKPREPSKRHFSEIIGSIPSENK
jgi:hypothetical protein